jgi:hypothetical protein
VIANGAASGPRRRRCNYALRRTLNLCIEVEGVCGQVESAVRDLQKGTGLTASGLVGAEAGERLQGRCGEAASDPAHQRRTKAMERHPPKGIDGDFGSKTATAAFQTWGGVAADGIVGDQTWLVPPHATNVTLRGQVGLSLSDGLNPWLPPRGPVGFKSAGRQLQSDSARAAAENGSPQVACPHRSRPEPAANDLSRAPSTSASTRR